MISHLCNTCENEKCMILPNDEIHIKPYLDYKAENIIDTTCILL